MNNLILSEKQNSTYDFVFYMRIFEGCNLYCDHCFIPSNPKRMNLDGVLSSSLKINELITSKDNKILVQWHGGEPSIMGAEFISKSIDIIKENVLCNVDFGIQTNLTILNDELLSIYKNKIKKGQFGISWDYKIRDFKNPKDLKFENVFWNNVKKVCELDIPIVLTMTSTRQFFNKFDSFVKLYTFCKKKGIEEVHIERLTKTGIAKDNWDDIGVLNKEYSDGMSLLFDGYFDYKEKGGKSLNISPFDGLAKSVYSLKDSESFSYGCWSGGCDTGFHTFDANGYKSGCTALNSEIDNKASSTVSIVTKDVMDKLVKRRELCDNCDYKSICSSGCGILDFYDESNECSGGKSLFNFIHKRLDSFR